MNNEYYPPEGNCALNLSDTCCIFFGGAHRSSGSAWNTSNTICKFKLAIEDDDVSIENMSLLKTPGACFPSLQGASALLKASEVVYVWGGLNLDVYKTTDELYILKLKPNDKCEVEILQNMMLDD